MAALASAVIVSAPQAKTYADTQTDDTQAVTEKLIDDQIATAEQPAEQKNSEKVNSDEKQNQQENSQLKSEKEITGFGSQALNHPAQATAVTGLGNEDLLLSEEKTPEAQQAGETGAEEDKNLQKADDPNYGEDEKKIKDYNGSERYKETDLQPGDTNQSLGKDDKKVEKDGLKFDLKNPSSTSTSKTEYGYQVTIDKETGQRTYTKIYVTDSGRAPVDKGDKPMMGQGDKLTPESPGVTYKPTENSTVDGAGTQRNLNYEASKETLEHINNKDNDSTSFGMKDNYTKEDPAVKFFGDSFLLGYKVNPWPNENDKLEELKLNKNNYDTKKKYFVQGQDIDTGIKVDNVDKSARERLVGQVYNPITGKIVPGASAYIADDGNIHIKLPEGALKKDESGKTVINEDSIFNTPDYKALQNLDVKFFARPRTKDEFKNIAETPDDFGDTGTYVETGAGTADINHKGTNVTIDKQGIDRYDHYNLIGDFKLNLDDTRYYDQRFVDGNNDETSKVTSSAVKPGEPFEVGIQQPENPSDTDKSAKYMNGAQDRGEAHGKLIMDFIDKANEGKADEDKWKVDVDSKDISKFTITPPSSAKAGEFVAIPVEYTYTNGSKDIHWFHFVVQESNNNIPTYDSDSGIADKKLTQKPEISQTEKDLKKNQPKSYKLAKTEYKDDKGNVWNVSIDETTGEVTATVPNNENIPEDGAKLNVDIEVTYEEEVKVGDQTEKRTYTEKTKAQFYSIPSTKQEVKKEFESELPYKTTFEYDNTIPAGKVVEEGGTVGKQKLVFSQIVVGNKKGALDENGKFVEGKEAVSTEIITPAVDKVIKIGTKPAETTVEIPKGLDYELDYSKKDGDPEVVEEGNDGVVTIKTTRDPQTGEITVTKTTTTEAKNKKIKIPAGTEGTHEYTEKKPFTYDIQFDPDFYKNYPDAKDNYKIVTEGKVGEKTTKWTIKNSKIVGDPEVTETDPTNAVIKVGQKDYTGEITHKETHEVPFEVEYKYSDELEAGQTKVEQKGEKGSYDIEYSQKIKNGEADGKPTSTKTNEKEAKKEIVVIGTKPVTKVVEKPFNTEYVYDENLEVGKTEEVTPGKNGKVTITTTYDKDQKKVVTSETEEAGQNRVVKIGGKTNGTEKIKEEIPFEVEVRKDPSLKKGEWKYATDDEGKELKGEKGEQEKTLTIVNSKVTETSEPTVTKKAKKAVILVGEGTNDGTHEIKEKKELPFETRYEYDENLEAGQREETGGEPGEQERTNTLVIKDGKVTETKEGEFKTTKDPVDKVIKIGIKPIVKEVEKPFETEYIYDENVEMGKEEEVTPGEKGKVTITTSYDKDQNKLVTKEETKDPVKRVVKVGIKPVVKEEEIPHDTEYKHNPELKAGEIKKIKDGTPGKVTITTTFNKETGKIETKVERTEPTKAVYEYGSKTDGKVKVESDLPFEVEIIKDPEMEAGKTETVQEGKLGKKETTITVENSKEVSREEKVITEPVKKIVKVGTKNVCEIPPVKPEDPTKPGKEDPTKPGKEDPTKPGKEDPTKPGKEDPTKPGKEDPTKPGKEDPTKPGKEDPTKPGKEDPTKPGEKDPEDPTKPGEKDSEKPGTPGEKSNEPGTPGKTPEENGKTPKENGKTPENNGKTPEENGKTPENNGKTPENNGKTPDNSRGDSPNKPNETPKTPETTEQGKRKEKADTPNRKSANKLPKAGSESEIMMLSMSALMTAAGFIGLKKKRKDR